MLADYAEDFSYDYLFALQGKLWCINALIDQSSKSWTARDAELQAQEILDFTAHRFNFYYSEAGALSRSATVLAHNSLAHYGLQNARDQNALAQALEHANAAISDTDYESPAEAFSTILQNKVEILLRLNRRDDAYALVYQMNRQHPGFAYFEDLAKTADYARWDAEN
jgi:hypothetical protein